MKCFTFLVLGLTNLFVKASENVIGYVSTVKEECPISCHTQLQYKQIRNIPCCKLENGAPIVIDKQKILGKGTYGTVYDVKTYRKVKHKFMYQLSECDILQNVVF